MKPTICHECDGYENAPSKIHYREQRVEFDDYCVRGNGTDLVTGKPKAVKCRDKNDGDCDDFSPRVYSDRGENRGLFIRSVLIIFSLAVVVMIILPCLTK